MTLKQAIPNAQNGSYAVRPLSACQGGVPERVLVCCAWGRDQGDLVTADPISHKAPAGRDPTCEMIELGATCEEEGELFSFSPCEMIELEAAWEERGEFAACEMIKLQACTCMASFFFICKRNEMDVT